MTAYDTLDLARDTRGVVTVTLNRPDKHNAMDAAMIGELKACAETLGADPEVRVVILTGQGRSFCAGGDLAWMRAQMTADAATRAREARALAEMLGVWNRLPKPVIGRIQGQALGGGVGLMSVCDVAIASASARFGLTETRLGLIPATIGPYVLARMGAAYARRVFMSARIFGAEEAVALGLAARAVAPEDLDAAIEAEVVPYLATAPGAVAEAKALALRLGGAVSEAEIDSTIDALIARWESNEAAEGIDAFFAKRPAPWVSET